MHLKALIFDLDGTLIDSEEHGHMAACNEAFATLDFDVQWDWPTYKTLLKLPGNYKRMRYSLAQRYPEMSAADLDETAAQLYSLKNQFFVEKYFYQVPVREGVFELLAEAVARDIKLAVVTMSHEAQAHALLSHHLPDFYPYFQPILGNQAGPKAALDSPLHRHCLQALGIHATEALMIEDSSVGFQAAQRAGIACAVIYNDYTFGEDFTGAPLVAKSLAYFDLDLLVDLCLPSPE